MSFTPHNGPADSSDVERPWMLCAKCHGPVTAKDIARPCPTCGELMLEAISPEHQHKESKHAQPNRN